MTQQIIFLQAFIKQWEAVDGSPELTIMYKAFCKLAGVDADKSADENLIYLTKQYAHLETILFMYTDKTGRGIKNKLTLNQILDMQDAADWNGDSLHEWAQDAEEGDEWDGRTEKYTRI